jgi:hypothetical protein
MFRHWVCLTEVLFRAAFSLNTKPIFLTKDLFFFLRPLRNFGHTYRRHLKSELSLPVKRQCFFSAVKAPF